MIARTLSLAVALVVPLVASAAGPSAVATLKDAGGKDVGTATFTAAKGGVKVRVAVKGLPPGRHGIHIHGAGKCDPPDFTTAGGHFNPFAKHHGLRSPEGAHAGDMPNLIVGERGRAKATLFAKGATLGAGEGSLFGPEGTALVIHAGPDDQRTDPAGNSGARIACGVIEKR